MPRPNLKRISRLSLRGLLVVVTLLCVLLALKVRQVERQKAAVEWVAGMGGNVLYDYEFDGNGEWIPNATAPGPKWLRESAGMDYVATVVRVFFDNSGHITDVSPLAKIDGLEQLGLAESAMTWQRLPRFQETLPECEVFVFTTTGLGP